MVDTKQDLSFQLKIEQLRRILDNAAQAVEDFTKLAEGSNQLKEDAENEITKYALSLRSSKLDKDELGSFFQYPYCILPAKREGEYYLAIPKFINAQFGWLEKVTPSYNIFLVNKYVDWLGELPQALKKELKFPDPLNLFFDGEYLVGPDIAKAKEKYAQFIKREEKDGRLLIDKSKHFEMLANLIKDGILPFIPKPIEPEDYTERKCDFELRPYQKEAWEEFKKYSNIGAFFPPSTGKTFLGIYAMTHIKPPHLVVVPSKLLIEQWKERIELYTDLQPNEYDVMTYYAGIKSDKKYKLMIIDEAHHLPANEFSKLATIQKDYCMGLSATPQREDGREEYIFALTGKPVGLAWEHFKKLGIIANPPLHVWIVKNETDRIKQVDELLRTERKTIIFADSIEMGRTYSKRFDIPHVYGDTKQRLSKIQDNLVTIVSRVGDEGVSLPDIERVIEISWLYGSRRQELQRFTRLLHGKGTSGEGHIIMTVQEYQSDHKRLFGIMDKGFKIVLHREGIEDREISKVPISAQPRPRLYARPTRTTTAKPEELTNTLSEQQYPLLKYLGIRKIVESLSKGQRKVMLFLIDPQNQNQSFTVQQIAMSLGYKNPLSLIVHPVIPPLVKKGYVLKDNNKFKQNFSAMV